VRGHVDAGGSDRERRSTGKVTNSCHLCSQAARHIDKVLVLKTKLVAETKAEIYGMSGLRSLVLIR
jgi:hypothetical protein